MKRRPRIDYSASQRALMWEHWRKGETLHQIARLFDRYHSSVQGRNGVGPKSTGSWPRFPFALTMV